MPKRLLDRLSLFGRARLDVTIATGAARSPQRRYTVNLLDMSDPSHFRDEAVATLHELLDLGVRGHFIAPYAISFAIANAAAAASPPTTPVCQALRKGRLPVNVPFT